MHSWRLVPLAVVAALPLWADIIDRIAVSVATRVITTSDLDREIRVTSFLNGVKPDFSSAAKRAVAEKMVEQKLIQRELETSRYPTPSASEVQPILDDFRKKQFPTDDEYRRALAEYGITEQQVKDELLWQRTMLRFIDVRFRPGIRVTEQEIRDDFDKVVAPAAMAARPGETPVFEEYHDQIEEKLIGDRVDKALDAWLKEMRKRTDIVFHDEALR